MKYWLLFILVTSLSILSISSSISPVSTNEEVNISNFKNSEHPVASINDYHLFTTSTKTSDQKKITNNHHFEESAGSQNDGVVNVRMRRTMSSTAEQPDSGGRTSNLNIWLTILIVALLAAILA